jgi:hypothetical protein
VELTDLIRQAGAVAFAIPKSFLESVERGSIRNAQGEVRGADRRRDLRTSVESKADADALNQIRIG